MRDSVMSIGMVRVLKHDVETGKLIYDETFKNQITNYALGQAASAWTGAVIVWPSKIGVGTGSPPVGQTGTSPNDTALWNELANTRKVCDYTTTFLTYYSQYSVTYLQTEAQGTLTEAGLFDVNGNLWSHVILNGVTHDSTSTLSIQWQILQQGN